MASNGRRPQNIKSGISQQPLIRFSLNFKFQLREAVKKERRKKTYWILLKFQTQAYMTKPCFVNPSNEDNLKLLKLEYLINNFLDHTQFLNLCSYLQ